MTEKEDQLKVGAAHATKLLKGKVVARVWRHRSREMGIEFTDGTRLFVDHNSTGLEVSITGGSAGSETEES